MKQFDKHKTLMGLGFSVVMAVSAYTASYAVTEVTAEPAEPPSPGETRIITAWLHRHDWYKGVISVYKNSDLIREVSPAWYEIDESGGVRPIVGVPVNDPVLLKLVRDRKILLRPLVMNVAPSGAQAGLVRPLFSDAERRGRHVEAIVAIAVENGYDGIDLDYEGFRMPELEGLAVLIEELAVALHAEKKTLAVSLEAQADDSVIPAWRRIGVAADEVRIMTYGHKPPVPGPLADPARIASYLRRAVEAMPAEKLTHGVATYGLKWAGDGKSTSWTWEELTKPVKAAEVILNRDDTTRSAWYERRGDQAWYEDHESIEAKMALGREAGISRFALWRLGGEDPEIWVQLRKRLH